MLNVETSRELAKRVTVRERRCWRNSFETLYLCLPDGCLYVEGFILVGGDKPYEHGWCETAGGRIIDVTLCNETEPLKYYPGVKYTKAEGMVALVRGDMLLPLAGHSHGCGMDNPGYADAYQDLARDMGWSDEP